MKTFYYLILIPLSLLPDLLRYVLSDVLAFILKNVVGYRRKMIEKNLCISFPEKDEAWRKSIIKEFYSNLGDVIVEAIHAFTIEEAGTKTRITTTNPEVLDQLYEQGRSVILTGGHFVNWEAITQMGYRSKHDFYALYKPLKNSFMDEKVRKSRERWSTNMISIKDYRRYFTDLTERPKLFIFGIDQSPRKGKGIWMNFLNRETSVFTGPERLSKEFDLAVVVGRMKRTSRGSYSITYKLLSDDPQSTEENEITLASNRDLEEQIIQRPGHWLWSHNRWKHKREPDGKQTSS